MPTLRQAPVVVLLLIVGCSQREPQPDLAHDGMVLLPGGTFMMGTDSSEVPGLRAQFGVERWEFYAPELPRHAEVLDAFWMDRTEVTNEAFFRFLEANPEWRPERISPEFHNGEYLAHWSAGMYPDGSDYNPVTNITWYSAMAYCEWRGGRLPVEAEWEYAAGAGQVGSQFPWGDDMPDTTRANYHASGIGGVAPVMSYPPNAFGLYDMAGNVWEYVFDQWRDDYTEERVLVQGGRHAVGARRVIRGGSWGGVPINLRVRSRDSHPAEGAGPHVGFRCVRPVG